MTTKIKWVCTKCMWEGSSEDTNGHLCPECGTIFIIIIGIRNEKNTQTHYA